MDLGDDALRGLLGGGQTFYTFFAWPFATPYAWVVRNYQPLGHWPWTVTPLEVAVVAGAVVWMALAGLRTWRRSPKCRFLADSFFPETGPVRPVSHLTDISKPPP